MKLTLKDERGTKNHEQRILPMFPPLRELLQRWKGERRGNFPLEKMFTIGSCKKALTSACHLAGLPRFTHHHMRHFFCSNAIEQGIDFKTIADWLGHKDGGILVAKTYGHLRREHSEAMAQHMTFSLGEKKETPLAEATANLSPLSHPYPTTPRV